MAERDPDARAAARLPARLLGIGARRGREWPAPQGSTTRSRPPPRRRSCVRSRARRWSGRSFACSSRRPRRTRSSARCPARRSSARRSRPWIRSSSTTSGTGSWPRDEVQRLIERIATAPEIRQAIASQGVGLLDDIGRQIRDLGGRFDDALERVVRKIIGRPRTEPTRHVGLVTRGAGGAPRRGDPQRAASWPQPRCSGSCSRRSSTPTHVSAIGIVLGAGAWITHRLGLPLHLLVARGPNPGHADPVHPDREGRVASPGLSGRAADDSGASS